MVPNHQPDHDLTSKNGGMAWSGWSSGVTLVHQQFQKQLHQRGNELSPLTLMGISGS